MLPTKLTRGINIPYIFGALEYYYLTGQTASTTYNPINATHMNDLLISSDFRALRWLDPLETTPTQEAFRHVRLIIDPYALGFLSDGTRSDASNFVANREALRDTIVEATGQGLGVILDVHPTIITQADAQFRWTNYYGKTGTCPNWPGIMKFPMVTLPTPGQSTIPSDHPLLVFWDWFSTQIKSWSNSSTYSGSINSNNVFLEIMNEPLVDFSENSTSWEAPTDFEGTGQTVKMRLAEEDWWRIQKAAINLIHDSNHLPGWWVIATSYNSDPRDCDGWRNDYGFKQKRSSGKPYPYNEVAGYDQVIYNFHFYHPFRYSHTDKAAFQGSPHNISDGDPEYTTARDCLRSTPLASQQNPHFLGYPEDEVLPKYELDHAIISMLQDMTTWINSNDTYIPAHMVTEFGAMRRNSNGMCWCGGLGYADGNAVARERAQYYSDVRTMLESQSWGWSVFSQYGDFNVWQGAYWNDVGSGIDTRYSGSRSWLADMIEALFIGW